YLYAAPECHESAKDVYHRCDIYSLGMTALFAFHGQRLPQAVLRRTSDFVEALAVPPRAKAALLQAIQDDPEERYESVAACCEALREAFLTPTPVQTVGAAIVSSIGMRLVRIPKGLS